MSLGVDYKDFLENIRLAESDGLLTPIRYLTWSLAAGNDARRSSTTSFGRQIRHSAFRQRSAESPDKRYKGKANYMYVQGSARHMHGLPANFQIVGVSEASIPEAAGQQRADLDGGAETVRGYLESSQLGDYGFSGTLELRNAWISGPLGLPPGSAYARVL